LLDALVALVLDQRELHGQGHASHLVPLALGDVLTLQQGFQLCIHTGRAGMTRVLSVHVFSVCSFMLVVLVCFSS
jgi:hypothetical protein